MNVKSSLALMRKELDILIQVQFAKASKKFLYILANKILFERYLHLEPISYLAVYFF